MTKKFLFALFFKTRLTQLIAWFNRKKVPILCYHSVTKQRDAYLNDLHKLHLHVDSFVQHLDYLETHYQLISLEEFVKARQENIKLPSGAVILTFDDGMRNFLTVVAPLLLSRAIPATSFIVTGQDFTQKESQLGSNWRPQDDDIFLSWNEVRQLADLGFEFGSHTCTHVALPDVPLAQAHSELGISLDTLNEKLGFQSFPLSFPHGKYSEELSRLSKSLGYSCAVTTALGQNHRGSDLFALHRTVIAADDDLPTFAARLSGLTYYYNRVAGLFGGRIIDHPDTSAVGYDPLVAEELTSSEGISSAFPQR